MDILNVIFGLIGILSFGYAIWANQKLQSVEAQRNRAISSIRDIAYRLYQMSPESITGGASFSIMRICESLVPTNAYEQPIGRIRLDYPPWEQPPMHSHGGRVLQDSRTRLGLAWESFINTNRPRFYAVFGPYHPLPLLGNYNVKFKICLVNSGKLLQMKLNSFDKKDSLEVGLAKANEIELNAENIKLLRLDIYAYTDGKTILSEKFIEASELSSLDYNEFSINFDYSRSGQILEFRVEILTNEVTIRISDIRVEYNSLNISR